MLMIVQIFRKILKNILLLFSTDSFSALLQLLSLSVSVWVFLVGQEMANEQLLLYRNERKMDVMNSAPYVNIRAAEFNYNKNQDSINVFFIFENQGERSAQNVEYIQFIVNDDSVNQILISDVDNLTDPILNNQPMIFPKIFKYSNLTKVDFYVVTYIKYYDNFQDKYLFNKVVFNLPDQGTINRQFMSDYARHSKSKHFTMMKVAKRQSKYIDSVLSINGYKDSDIQELFKYDSEN